MNKLQASLLAAILGITATTGVYASQDPTMYECKGKNVNLTLTTGNGKANDAMSKSTFMLKLGQKMYTFEGEDIANESTLIGDLWEVTLNFIVDVSIEHASVVIPEIKLGEAPVKFKSQLILTKVATPFISTPFEGVVNSSKYIDINCVASLGYYSYY